ncbi:BON domain-containing protein [Streptomyces sp. NPDC056628]|uniref:BON domain-containing protein n=1 Tax=Streptomyces sp. NPDC056628 TaxID=3345882 RepID=UPI0036A42572
MTGDILPRAPPSPGTQRVTVPVRDGVVTLTGRLEERDAVFLAVQLAWRADSVLGVVGVVNDLTADSGTGVSPGRCRVP